MNRKVRHLQAAIAYALISGLCMYVLHGAPALAWAALADAAGRAPASPHSALAAYWTTTPWIAAVLAYTLTLFVTNLAHRHLRPRKFDFLSPALSTLAYLVAAVYAHMLPSASANDALSALPWILLLGADGSALVGFLIPVAVLAVTRDRIGTGPRNPTDMAQP